MSNKKFFAGTVGTVAMILAIVVAIVVVVDPFFHFHKPLNQLKYPILNQRYQNDGILRNFDYDSIIIGTSMTENFSASQWNTLFDAKTVKVPLAGSFLKETADRLDRAFASDNQIKYVVRSLDLYAIKADKDTISDFTYPNYLYDNSVFNDVSYVLNKSVLFEETLRVLLYTLKGNTASNFDNAFSWSDDFKYGKQEVLKRYTRSAKIQPLLIDFDMIKTIIKANMEQNIIRLAVEHPETDFYLFYPPYSIVMWDSWNQSGELTKNIEIMRYVSELLLEYDNIYLFSFDTDYKMICDLNNYKDLEHYGGWINEVIFENMKNKKGLLTKENLDAHFHSMTDFYSQYNYDAIFVLQNNGD